MSIRLVNWDLPLSPAELRVLRYVAQGLSDPEIAAATWRSPNTIKTQVKSIRFKLNGRNKAHIVAIAYETGLLGDRFENPTLFDDLLEQARARSAKSGSAA